MSGQRLARIVAALCFMAAFASDVPVRGASPQTRSAGSQRETSASAAAAPAPRAVLDTYCIACHSETVKTAGLALDALDPAHVSDSAAVWEAVARKMRTGAMPPAGMPRPDKALSDSVVSWLETELDRAALDHPNPGRPTLHRLNRAEYRNAVRDLLALEIDVASDRKSVV